MTKIEKTETLWRLTGGGLALDLDACTGSLARLSITAGKPFEWAPFAGSVTVRDDRLGRTFDRRDPARVTLARKDNSLTIETAFDGAPWRLCETYRVESELIQWSAELHLDRGEFRSCAIGYGIPWPPGLFPLQFWAAGENMPSAPHRFAGVSLEYGEITSGILMPALYTWHPAEDVGLLVGMPFDFRTPRLRFLSGYRDPELKTEFDWLALAPGRPARATLEFRGMQGTWRCALGWLYERNREYFEPRSSAIDRLWGGHGYLPANISTDEARAMAQLGGAWCEIHGHFPAYGNYHPEGLAAWRSGHFVGDPAEISVDRIKRSISNLHGAGIAALPYLQVSGDADDRMTPEDIKSSAVLDRYGRQVSAWPGTHLMNSDPSLPFGRDIARQVDGMVGRYPEIDGVFLDQPCYNALDTAHDDGITAVDNRPCAMTGFNYAPHLERLSALLHPGKVIMANAPFGVGILKYFDGFMAEGLSWLCDHLQYYGLVKPMFFLHHAKTARGLEMMFQQCVRYGACWTSEPPMMQWKNLFELYVPLLRRLAGRRWVFDANPIELPPGVTGNVFRSPRGTWVAGLVSQPSVGHGAEAATVRVRTVGVEDVDRVILQAPGKPPREAEFGREDDAIQFDLGGESVVVAELAVRREKRV